MPTYRKVTVHAERYPTSQNSLKGWSVVRAQWSQFLCDPVDAYRRYTESTDTLYYYACVVPENTTAPAYVLDLLRFLGKYQEGVGNEISEYLGTLGAIANVTVDVSFRVQFTVMLSGRHQAGSKRLQVLLQLPQIQASTYVDVVWHDNPEISRV